MSKLSFVSFVFISKEVEEMLNSMTNYACSLMLTMPSATPKKSTQSKTTVPMCFNFKIQHSKKPPTFVKIKNNAP